MSSDFSVSVVLFKSSLDYVLKEKMGSTQRQFCADSHGVQRVVDQKHQPSLHRAFQYQPPSRASRGFGGCSILGFDL